MRRHFFPKKRISFLEKRQKTERFIMDRKTVQLGIYLRYKFNNRPSVFFGSVGSKLQIGLSSTADYITWKEAVFLRVFCLGGGVQKKQQER